VKMNTTRYDLRVNASGRALVVSSIPMWPGWRVRVNGTRVVPIIVNSAFIGFIVPPGTSDVRVSYVPMTFWIPAIASLLTSFFLLWKLVEPMRIELTTS
jgi:uncharacterized membrane protein YfhO